MTTDSITERLHAQADASLKSELQEHFRALWNEINPQGKKYPLMTETMRQLISNAGLSVRHNEDITCPYIGAIQGLYEEIAFAYLSPLRRADAVTKFMADVESMSDQLGQLQQDVANIDGR